MPRLTLYQGRPRAEIPATDRAAIAASDPDYLALPEYFWTPADAGSHREAAAHEATARRQLEGLSRELDAVVVGGTLVVADGGRFFNTCPIYERGHLVGEQRKLFPTEREVAAGVSAGDRLRTIAAGGHRVGILVCADVLRPQSFATMRELGAELVFAPTLSPYLAGDTADARADRDRSIFAAGAVAAGAPVAKVCGVGTIFGGRLQGRSLVATPDGAIPVRVPVEGQDEVQVIACDVKG